MVFVTGPNCEVKVGIRFGKHGCVAQGMEAGSAENHSWLGFHGRGQGLAGRALTAQGPGMEATVPQLHLFLVMPCGPGGRCSTKSS